jgi:CheY-specific phosphatase CheX
LNMPDQKKRRELPPDIERKLKQYFSNINTSLQFIFKSLLDIDLEPRKLYRRRLATLPNDLIITIDYQADLIGYFSFLFSLKTAFEICSRLVTGIDNRYFDSDHLDIIGELGNMIAGNAMGRLKDIDVTIKLSAPYLSAFHTILASEKLFWTFSCNYDIDIGQLGILLAVKKPNNATASADNIG